MLADGDKTVELASKVSIIIVTRNRPEKFLGCLKSLQAGAEGAEFIAVDDFSDTPYAGSVVADGVRVIGNSKRLYLNESRNLGAALATRQYLFFVDDDNVVGQDVVPALVKTLDSSKNVGVVAPVALASDGRVWYAGGWISPFSGLSVFTYRGHLKSSLPSEPYETRLFHNCFMIRRDLFRKLGGFDSVRFPMYLAEADASERLGRLGYTVVVDPDAVVSHGIDTRGVRSLMRNVHITEPARAYFVGRNRILFMRIHRAGMRYLIFLAVFQPVVMLVHLASIAGSRQRAYRWTYLAGPYLRGVIDGILGQTRFGARYSPSILKTGAASAQS